VVFQIFIGSDLKETETMLFVLSRTKV